MALPLLAQAGIAAIPSATNLIGNWLGGNKKTESEKELSGLAGTFKDQMNTPYLDTTEAKSFTSLLDKRDDKQRRRVKNAGIREGMTDEARLAEMQTINEGYADSMTRLVGNADRHRQRMLSNYLGTMQGAEQSRQARVSQHQGNMGDITGNLGEAINAWLKTQNNQPNKLPKGAMTENRDPNETYIPNMA